MQIIIKETGEIERLQIIDTKTGCEWTADLIEAGGRETDDDGTVIMTQDDFDWWTQYISDTEQTEEDAQDLADELEDADFNESEHRGSALQYIMFEIGKNTGNDYDNHRAEAVKAMEEIREKYLK